MGRHIDHRPSCSRLSLTDNTIHLSKRVTFKSLEQNKNITDYKIKGNNFDGLNWKIIDILIDTGAASCYISKNLTCMLELKELAEPVKYINFNGEEFRVTKFCTVLIRLANQEIKFPSKCHPRRLRQTNLNRVGIPMHEVHECRWRIR